MKIEPLFQRALDRRRNTDGHFQELLGSHLKTARPQTKVTRLFFFVPRSQLHQGRKHSLWHVLRDPIERLQFLSNRGARGTTRHCFRRGHVIRFIAGSRAVICHGRKQQRAPHEQLMEGADNLFLKQKKCPDLETGANSWRVSHRGAGGAGPDPPSMLMFLRY